MAASKKQIDSVKINVIFLFTETLLKLKLTCIIIRHFNLFLVSGGNWKTVEYTIEPWFGITFQTNYLQPRSTRNEQRKNEKYVKTIVKTRAEEK